MAGLTNRAAAGTKARAGGGRLKYASGALGTHEDMQAVDEERFLEQLGLKPWHWVPPAVVRLSSREQSLKVTAPPVR